MKSTKQTVQTVVVNPAKPAVVRVKSRVRAGYDPDTDMSRGGGSQDMSSGGHDMSRGH